MDTKNVIVDPEEDVSNDGWVVPFRLGSGCVRHKRLSRGSVYTLRLCFTSHPPTETLVQDLGPFVFD